MNGMEFSEAVARQHAPLVQWAAGIAAAQALGSATQLRDVDDRTPQAGKHVVTLERNAVPEVIREGGQRFRLRYDEATSEAALAALLACSAKPGMPIAADTESLSVLALADRLAASDIPVLINGPTGTGKEVLSRFIHNRSQRADKPFVAVNCAAMPEAMLEAMLFGHQKGAFTGATSSSEGFFRAADGGTLLLDEIAEMPLALQAKLLRALQESEVVPIGSTLPIKIDVRVIACANRDLPTEVAEGRFRADLFYRLNVFPLSLKPLRDRAEDIAPLAFALALRHAPQGKAMPWISDAALALLKIHGWPGNVRELENVVRRALLLAEGKPTVGPEHIVFDGVARLVPSDMPMGVAPMSAAGMPMSGPMSGAMAGQMPGAEPTGGKRLSNIVQLSEARAIMATLEACGGSRVQAARQLGISERTLRYRLASFREAGIAVAGGRR